MGTDKNIKLHMSLILRLKNQCQYDLWVACLEYIVRLCNTELRAEGI